MNRIIALFLLFAILPAQAAETLTLGVYADRPAYEMEARYQALAKYLSARLPDAQVVLKVLDAKEIDEEARHGKLDLVLTTPDHYLRLHDKGELSALLATRISRSHGQGSDFIGGVIISRAGRSDIAALSDLKDRLIAVPDSQDMGGYQAPVYELMQAGLRVPGDIRLLKTAGNLEVIEAVLSGRVDAGFVRCGTIEAQIREGKLAPTSLQVINRQNSFRFPHIVSTRLYPEWPLVAMRHVPAATAKNVANALLALKKDDPAALTAHIEGFAPAADYQPVESLARALRLPPYDVAPLVEPDEVWRQYSIGITAAALAMLLMAAAFLGTMSRQKKTRKAEQTLRMEKQHLEDVIKDMNVGVWEWNIQTGQTVVNDRWVEISGYQTAELLPVNIEDWLERVHPDDRDYARALLQRCFYRESDTYDCEVRLWHGNGRWIWIHDHGRIIEWSADGKPLRMTGTRYDISVRKRNETIVTDSEHRLRTIFDILPVGIALFDPDGYILECNSALESMLGINRTEQLTRKFDGGSGEIYRPDGSRMPFNEYACARAQAEQLPVQNIVMEVRRSPKESIWLNTSATPLEHPSYGAMMVCIDITQAREAEASLQLAASVFTHAREGIVISDANATIIDVNAAFTQITGYTRDEVIGRKPGLLNSGMQTADFYADMWQILLEKGHWYGELWNRRKNGEIYPEMMNISAVFDQAGRARHYVSLSTDITQLKNHQKQLEYIAHYDVLTNLPNRLLFAEHLHQAMAQMLRRDMQLAVVYIDLDGFKSINDKHGHDVGDELLIELAQRMRAVLREGDIMARLGGDEFAAVLVDLHTVADCQPVLSRLLHAASDPVEIDDTVLHVSASIGYTLYPKDNSDADLLLRHADQAMYSAKQMGKNCSCLFDVAQEAIVQAQREATEQVRQALDRGEFVLFYQPWVNMRTGETVGAEALIRWQHPKRGLLPPGEFLPAIENRPLEIMIGEWVIQTAVSQIQQWNLAGLDIRVSVNIASRQLQHADLVSGLRQSLATLPDPLASRLDLEVIETHLVDDLARTREIMNACRELGVSFVLDDFGTGYSSLNYLKRLPADVLKIDQSFVRKMPSDPEELLAVEGMLGLAKTFRRKTVAEGVETTEQGELLLLMGCDYAQGYGIARPMPARELAAWTREWRPSPVWTRWRDREVRPGTVPLLFATAGHRQWMQNLQRFLRNEKRKPPPVDKHSCRFCQWRSNEALLWYAYTSQFQEITAMHDQLHLMSEESIALHGRGESAELAQRMDAMQALSDSFVEAIYRVIRENAVEKTKDGQGAPCTNGVK